MVKNEDLNLTFIFADEMTCFLNIQASRSTMKKLKSSQLLLLNSTYEHQLRF